MKNLILSSSFADVAKLFAKVSNNDFHGKKVTFIPTASIPESVNFYVEAGRNAFKRLGLTVVELELTTASKQEVNDKLRENDYIYISGGNTFFLLQELIKSEAANTICELVNEGKPFIGESAGSIVLSPNIEYIKDMDNCDDAPELKTFSGLGIVDFYPLPHHKNFPFKKAVEKIISKHEKELKLIPFSNSQAIIVRDGSVNILSK